MIFTLCIFMAGIVLLTVGAELFVRGSSSLAERLGLSNLVVGLTIVAFGTSAPELFVSVKSALAGAPGIAAGNVIGSNIANIALILGCCALITPLAVQLQIIKRDMPFMILISAVACLLLIDRQLSRIDAIVLLLLFAGYITMTVVLGIREPTEGASDEHKHVTSKPGMLFILFMIAGGLGALLFGSNLLIDASVTFARFFNVSETIIGISIVAVGTSLPELAASLMAAIKKESDIAIGNIVGSNVFNTGLVLGCAGAISPFSIPEMKLSDLAVMFTLSLLLLPFLKSGFRLNRVEGAILLTSYAAYIFFIWQ